MRNSVRLVIPLMLLSACAGASDSGNGLANTSWHFAAIDGAPPVSERAQLDFRRGQLSANAGCNGMGGAWRIEGGRLIAGPLMQTEMYCEGPVWGQEQALSALLTSGPGITVENDRMVLKSSGHSAELRKQR